MSMANWIARTFGLAPLFDADLIHEPIATVTPLPAPHPNPRYAERDAIAAELERARDALIAAFMAIDNIETEVRRPNVTSISTRKGRQP